MKVRFDLFVILVTIGKAFRYAAVIAAVVGIGQLFS
jgi:membrane protein YqaA with SNARE-associated domain